MTDVVYETWILSKQLNLNTSSNSFQYSFIILVFWRWTLKFRVWRTDRRTENGIEDQHEKTKEMATEDIKLTELQITSKTLVTLVSGTRSQKSHRKNGKTVSKNKEEVMYTVSHKKTCHFVFDNNSGVSWSIFILFVPIETGRNTLQLFDGLMTS